MKKTISLILTVFFAINTLFASDISLEEFGNAKKQIQYGDIFNYAKITDSYFTNDTTPVIWIQDLHNSPSIQTNIYNLLKILSSNNNLDGIYIEGADNKLLDTAILKNIPNTKIKNATITNLFKSGILSGCEYFALTNDSTKIYGIENKQLYRENLIRLEKINSQKQFNNYLAEKIISFSNNLRNQFILNSISLLQSQNLNSLLLNNNFPNLYKQQNALEIFSNIDHDKLNIQLNNLLTYLKETISFEEYIKLSNFLKLNTNYGYAKAYDYINANFPSFFDTNNELKLYLQTNKILLEINPVKLLYESENFKKQLLSDVKLNNSEKEIIDLNYFSNILKDLVNTTILPQHYSELKNNKDYIVKLTNKYLPATIKSFALFLLNNKDFFDFYDTNLYRNKIFTDNIYTNIDSNKIKIIIAGGFHTGLLDELKKQQQSYIVLTPNIDTPNAFNNLFLSNLKFGTNQQIVDKILSIVGHWGIFFKDEESFQTEISKWIRTVPDLENLKVEVLKVNGGYNIKVNFNGFIKSETYTHNLNQKQPVKFLTHSKKQINKTKNKLLIIAQQPKFFGKNVEIKTNNDKSLFDSCILLPIELFSENNKTIISINSNFLSALSTQNDSLIETVISLLYFYSVVNQDTESFQKFITDNYDKLKQIYAVNQQAQIHAQTFLFKLKSLINDIIEKSFSILQTKKSKTLINFEQLTKNSQSQNQHNMIEAIKQAELARQSRSYLRAFTQPPVGAYIINDNGITGRAYNMDNSVLHAETLTFIDFLKNYIEKEELLPAGQLTNKGNILLSLLNLTITNGQNIENRTFQNRPIILENLGIIIDYRHTRSVADVFNETNSILKFVDDQLDNPLRTASLYCTLAPCNKCVKTMTTIGINKLVYGSYSINKSHNGVTSLREHGILVEEGLLSEQTNKYIKNYAFINASKIGTRISSLIQTIRRKISSIFHKTNKILQETLYSDILSLELNESKQIIENIKDLQINIDWGNIYQSQYLAQLKTFLQRIDCWDNYVKRASMIYVLKNKINPVLKNNGIHFQNKKGQILKFYINIDGQFTASKGYISKLKNLAQIRNFADLDDNLAVRKSPFTEKMKNIFAALYLYGIAQPIIITGNTIDETNRRLANLGEIINSLSPSIYIENAALQCNYIDGKFKNNMEYMHSIANSFIETNILNDVKNIMSQTKQQWYKMFNDFIQDTKEIRNNTNLTYYELAKCATKRFNTGNTIKFILNTLELQNEHDLFLYWGNLTHAEASLSLNRIDNAMKDSHFSESAFLNTMELLSVLEISRLYFSKDINEEKECKSLRKDIEKCDLGEKLPNDFPSDVRYALSPVRPTLIREKIAAYYNPIIQQKYPYLEVRSSGHTTISIYKKNIDKLIPIKHAKNEGVFPEYIIYTGDEFNIDGVDYPVYLFQQQKENKDMVIINTNGQHFEGSFISLYLLLGFSDVHESEGNIERSTLLQNIILKILEEQIEGISTDSNFVPANIAQELKIKILQYYNILDLPEIQTQSADIQTILKAG